MRAFALMLMLAIVSGVPSGLDQYRDTDGLVGSPEIVAQSCNPRKHRCG